MSYYEWYEAAQPIVAQAHFHARSASNTPQAYAYDNTSLRGYGRARERNVKRSRKDALSWEEVPIDLKALFRALAAGFEEIVQSCTAPEIQYCVRTAVGASCATTDLHNVIGFDLYQQSLRLESSSENYNLSRI